MKKLNTPVRAYDNTLRMRRSSESKQKIIEAMVQLLVENHGNDFSIQQIATRSGLNPRTIFRFYKDKTTLNQAIDEHLTDFLNASAQSIKSDEFILFAKNLFEHFDKNDHKVTAYLFSSVGHKSRILFRKKVTEMMLSKIMTERKLGTHPDIRKRVALICSLVNDRIWYDVKTDFGYNGTAMVETMDWALNCLLDKVEHSLLTA